MATLNRRSLLLGGTALVGLAAIFPVVSRSYAGFIIPAGQPGPVPGSFEVTHTDDEWKQILGDDAYQVMRQRGTEVAGSSPLNDEHREGIFACAGCDLPLFDSKTKFDSGTGWPSFYQSLDNATALMPDPDTPAYSECHCRRCGGHLGHRFDDGPQPTGWRYCMDGVALKFHPKAA